MASPKKVEVVGEAAQAPVIDATARSSPKGQEGQRYAEDGSRCLDSAIRPSEGRGTMGRTRQVHLVSQARDVDKLAWPIRASFSTWTQTTLSVDDTREVIEALLKRRFPRILGRRKESATRRRTARPPCAESRASRRDLVGGQEQSNSNRLRRSVRDGVASYLIDDAATAFDPAGSRAGIGGSRRAPRR